jgi:hypothetical protein
MSAKRVERERECVCVCVRGLWWFDGVDLLVSIEEWKPYLVIPVTLFQLTSPGLTILQYDNSTTSASKEFRVGSIT